MQHIVEAARRYYNIGLNVIPIKLTFDKEKGKWIKRPLIDTYTEFHRRRQTKEEFEKLSWAEADGFGVICGQETERGYFFAIDIDLPLEEALSKLRAFHGFKITRMEKTISGRLHLLYFSEKPVPSFKSDKIPLELIGRGKICVMAPSRDYQALNDNMPSRIEDGYQYFVELAKHFGYDVESELAEKVESTESKDVLEVWLKQIIESGKLEVKGRGPNYYYIRCPFHPPDRHPSFAINHKKFYAIDYHDGAVYSLKELASRLGISLESEHAEATAEERKPKKVKVSKPIKLDDVVIEPLECGLVVYGNGRIEVRETYEHEDHILVKDPWLDGVVVLPPEPINIDPRELWNMTRKFIEEYIYLEDPRQYEVLTAFVAWSYFYDQNDATAYLYISGSHGTGKTRLLEVLRLLCYRSVLSSIARGPSLFRLIERLGDLTLLIDESQIRDKDVADLLRVGYRRGNVIIRVEKENNGFELRKFETYCFKAFASVEEPSEDIKQRSITIHMIKNMRPVGRKLDEEVARKIRGGWFYQRLMNRIEVSGSEYASKYQDSRMEEICSPLMTMALRFNPEAAETIRQYFAEMEEARAEEIRAGLEAEIIEYLLKKDYEDCGCRFIAVSELVEALNNRYSAQKIGRCLTRLGFKKRRDKILGRGYEIDRNLLKKLAIIYRVEAPQGDGAINQIILGN